MTGDGGNDAAAIRTADIGIGIAARDPLALLDAVSDGRPTTVVASTGLSLLASGEQAARAGHRAGRLRLYALPVRARIAGYCRRSFDQPNARCEHDDAEWWRGDSPAR